MPSAKCYQYSVPIQVRLCFIWPDWSNLEDWTNLQTQKSPTRPVKQSVSSPQRCRGCPAGPAPAPSPSRPFPGLQSSSWYKANGRFPSPPLFIEPTPIPTQPQLPSPHSCKTTCTAWRIQTVSNCCGSNSKCSMIVRFRIGDVLLTVSICQIVL